MADDGAVDGGNTKSQGGGRRTSRSNKPGPHKRLLIFRHEVCVSSNNYYTDMGSSWSSPEEFELGRSSLPKTQAYNEALCS